MAQAAPTTPSPIEEVDMGSDSNTVRATIVQASTVFYDTPATLDKAKKFIAEATVYGSQLVVFPGSYPHDSNFGVMTDSRSDKGKEDFQKYHTSIIDVPGPEVDRLAAMAGKYKVYLVMGVIERAGYTLYCTILFFDDHGRYLGKHRKLMPTALERVIWGFGDGSTIHVYETPIEKIGALICWENQNASFKDCSLWKRYRDILFLHYGCQGCLMLLYVLEEVSIFLLQELFWLDQTTKERLSADIDFGKIVNAKFDFDVVGHYSRSEVLSLSVKDHQLNPVTFSSKTNKAESSEKSC